MTLRPDTRLAIGLALSAVFTACSPGPSAPPPQPAASASAARDIPLPAPTPEPAATVAAHQERGSNELTGRWEFFIRTNAWATTLARAEGLPDEYEGDAVRDTSNAAGAAVRLKIGALLVNGRLKVWLGPGIIVCEAPFKTSGTMRGQCRVALGTGETGAFSARRIE